MKKALYELGSDEEEGESESKVMNHIFGCLQQPKMLLFVFSSYGGVCHKRYKSKYHATYGNPYILENCKIMISSKTR